MQYAPDAPQPALLEPPFCCTCRHYQDPDQDSEPMCFKGVHFGTARVTAVSAKTMRSDSWWGAEACGKEGKHWEAKA